MFGLYRTFKSLFNIHHYYTKSKKYFNFFNNLYSDLGGNSLIYNESEDTYYIQHGADTVRVPLVKDTIRDRLPFFCVTSGGFEYAFDIKKVKSISVISNRDTVGVSVGNTIDGPWTVLGTSTGIAKTYDVSGYSYARVGDTVGGGYRYCYVDGPVSEFKMINHYESTNLSLLPGKVKAMTVNYTDAFQAEKYILWGDSPVPTTRHSLIGSITYNIEEYRTFIWRGTSKKWFITFS